MKTVRRFFDIVFRAEEWVSVVTLAAMAIVVIVQVLFRYVLSDPFVWTEELSRFLYIWLIMLGAGHSIRLNGHVRIELLMDMLPRPVQRFFDVAIPVIALAAFAIMLPYMFNYAKSQHKILSTALRLPYSMVYGAVFVGCVFILLHLVEKLLNIFAPEKAEETSS